MMRGVIRQICDMWGDIPAFCQRKHVQTGRTHVVCLCGMIYDLKDTVDKKTVRDDIFTSRQRKHIKPGTKNVLYPCGRMHNFKSHGCMLIQSTTLNDTTNTGAVIHRSRDMWGDTSAFRGCKHVKTGKKNVSYTCGRM